MTVTAVGGVVAVGTAAAAVAIVAGVLVHQPRRAVPWALLAVGCAVQAAATVALVTGPGGPGDSRPGWPQAIAVLAYPALFVGLVGITTRRPSSWSTTPLTAIASTAVATALLGSMIALPHAVRGDLPLPDADWAGVLAAGDIVLALVAARRVIGASQRNWSWWLLVAGFVAWGNAHAEVGAHIADGTFDRGSALNLLLVVGPLLVVASALLPSMAVAPAPPAPAGRVDAVPAAAWLLALPPIGLVVVRTAELHAARLWVVLPLATLLAVAVRRTAALAGGLDDTVAA